MGIKPGGVDFVQARGAALDKRELAVLIVAAEGAAVVLELDAPVVASRIAIPLLSIMGFAGSAAHRDSPFAWIATSFTSRCSSAIRMDANPCSVLRRRGLNSRQVTVSLVGARVAHGRRFLR
jgi:hypothetical protein